MAKFTLSQVRDAATYYREVATKLEAAADALSNVNPSVLIVIGEQTSETSSSTGVEQIKAALKKAGKPLGKKEIQKAINGSIKPDTLGSYLSKNKSIFSNPSRGNWGLVEWGEEKTKE